MSTHFDNHTSTVNLPPVQLEAYSAQLQKKDNQNYVLDLIDYTLQIPDRLSMSEPDFSYEIFAEFVYMRLPSSLFEGVAGDSKIHLSQVAQHIGFAHEQMIAEHFLSENQSHIGAAFRVVL